MAFSFGTFRNRSPERDRARDSNRVDKIRLSLLTAREDAEHERAGLERRIEEYLLRATLMLESSGEYAERSPNDEKEIVDAESQAQLGRQRVVQLDQQIAVLDRMLADLKLMETGVPAAISIGHRTN